MTPLFFTEEQMIAFLKKKGYRVARERVTMGFPEYHDEITHKEVEVWTVKTYNGTDFCRPCGYNFSSGNWVEKAFEKALTEALLTI